MTSHTAAHSLTLYGQTFPSRVLLGTSRYPSLQSLSDSIDAARPGMVTVALRRQSETGEAGFSKSSSVTASRCCQTRRAAIASMKC